MDIDSGVLVGGFLGPPKKCFLRRQVLLANNNVRDLKKKRKTISILVTLVGYEGITKDLDIDRDKYDH